MVSVLKPAQRTQNQELIYIPQAPQVTGSKSLTISIIQRSGIRYGKRIDACILQSTEREVALGWTESIIIPFFKKSSQIVCNNHSVIGLTQVAFKVLASNVLSKNRISPRKARGVSPWSMHHTSDNPSRLLPKHRHTNRRPTIPVFLDIRVAFYLIDRSTLWV